MSAVVREAAVDDAEVLARIYNPFIQDTIVTFEETPVSAAEMARRVLEVRDVGLSWLVAEEQGEVAGYAYAARWRARHAYRYTAETTVYLAPGAEGRGLGRRLYQVLCEDLAARGIHAVIGVIALPNPGSIALHERMGFTKVAHFPEVGFKFGRWIDVGYWQKLL